MLLAHAAAFVVSSHGRATPGPLRVLDKASEFDRESAEGEFRRRQLAALESASRASAIESLNDIFHKSDTGEADAKMPVHSAPWAMYPGLREVLHVHRPAFRYLFEEHVLRSENKTYVHVLDGADVGVRVRVLDSLRSGDSLFVLIHATDRVRVESNADAGSTKSPSRRELVRFADAIAPVRDDEERGVDDAKLALWDDPLSFDERWFLRGAGRRAPELWRAPVVSRRADADEALEGLETLLWRALDDLVALIRKSRTSGDFSLPPGVEALRPDDAPHYPPARRALRLSFSLANLLDLGKTEDRQHLIALTSTKRRLAHLLAITQDQTRELAAALSLEQLRKDLEGKP